MTNSTDSKQEYNEEELLTEAFNTLEEGKFLLAGELFDKILKNNYRNSKSHIGKLLIEMGLKKESDLLLLREPLSKKTRYINALEFADEGYKDKLIEYNNIVEANLNSARKERALKKEKSNEQQYCDAVNLMKTAVTSHDYYNIISKLGLVSDYKDSLELQAYCQERASELDKKEYGNSTLWFVLNFGSIFLSNYLGVIGALFAFLAENDKRKGNIKKSRRKLRAAKIWFVIGVIGLVIINVIIPLINLIFSLAIQLNDMFFLYQKIMEFVSSIS